MKLFILPQTDWQCFSPDRLRDSHWQDIPLDEFACDPKIDAGQEILSIAVGSKGFLTCRAEGNPLPTMKWITGHKVLSNLTQIGESTDHYVVKQNVSDNVVYSTLELGIFGDHHPTEYLCVASNPSNSVEKIIQVAIGTDPPVDVVKQGGPSIYLLVGIVAALVLIVIILITIIICCVCKRKSSSTTPNKLNNGSVMIVEPPSSTNSINPIGKPPRQYEKIPQKDTEMTHIANPGMEGLHKSYEEVGYPREGHPTYSADPRSRLPPLAEEGPVGNVGNFPPTAPSPTLTIQSTATQQTTASHFPDLLDNARVPRTISPTQASYQSLAYPPAGQDWRFSYAHPADYGVTPASECGRSPIAYSTPQHQRPGYVTLPRRPRAPSWSGLPSYNPLLVPNPLASQTLPPHEVIYDTLGPRTTADGTSTTDLTRPGSRAALYEPLPPGASKAPPPTSPQGLAAHYNNKAASKASRQYPSRPGASQTLPRSTPNLLDDGLGLSIPQYNPSYTPQPLHAAEMQPLIEQNTLGIPYHPPETSHLLMNGQLGDNRSNTNSPSSTSTYVPLSSTLTGNREPNLRPSMHQTTTPPSSSPSSSPHLNMSSPHLNMSSPHQMPHDTRASPIVSNSPSPSQPLLNGSSNGGDVFLPPSSPLTLNNNTIPSGGPHPNLPKKKVPPKPPPKPSSKRLSLASNTSDSSSVRLNHMTSNGIFQDEGPDGSEVWDIVLGHTLGPANGSFFIGASD